MTLRSYDPTDFIDDDDDFYPADTDRDYDLTGHPPV